MSLRPLPSSTAKQLQPLFPAIPLSLKRNACTALAADSSYECKTFSFGPTGSETQLTLPLPPSVTQCAGAGQSLSIRCVMVHRSPPPLPLTPSLLPSSYSGDVTAAIAPAAAKRKKATKAASSAAPQAAGAGAGAGATSRRRRL
jgi:hypothetical protein